MSAISDALKDALSKIKPVKPANDGTVVGFVVVDGVAGVMKEVNDSGQLLHVFIPIKLDV